MSVHMIRYYASAEAQSFLIESYLPQWLTTHLAWQSPKQENEPPILRNTEPDGSGTDYYAADWRFAWGDNSKEVLLSNLVAYTAAYAPWYRVGWHECSHDEDSPRACRWQDKREPSDPSVIPEDVPDFEVVA